MTDSKSPAERTLRSLIAEFSDEALDSCTCTSLKVTLRTPKGGTLKSDYSAVREKKLASIREQFS